MSHLNKTSVGVFNNIEPNSRNNHIIALPFLTLGILLFGQILGIVPFMESGLTTPETIEQYPDILFMLFGPFSMLLVVLFMWVKFYEKRGLKSLGVALSNNTKSDFLKGYGTGLAMSIFIVLSVLLLGGYQVVENPSVTYENLLPPLLLLLGFGLQSTAEEIFFRGWLLSRFMEQKGVIWGVVGSSLMFTFVHITGEEFSQPNVIEFALFFFMTFAFSAYLAFETLKRGSIWYAAAWHAAWNWLFINGFGLATTGIDLDTRPLITNLDAVETSPEWLSGGLGGPENSIVTSFVLIIFSFLSWRSYRASIKGQEL